jgi:D-alanyl-D-alanine carboxypeptidase
VYSVAVASLLFVIGAFYYAQVFSYQTPTPVIVHVPAFTIADGSAPVLSVNSYLVFDTKTGEILASQNPDAVHPIASVTKLFTAAAILENFNPESTTTITWGDLSAEGEAGDLKPHQVYTYRELLFPLLLESSNDAALALEHSTKGELTKSLETVAKKYGAEHAHFADASGLSASNTATARDLMNFSRAVGEKYPFVYDISELPQYIGSYTGWLNNNPVFNTDSYRGGKHGYTPAAGRTLVAQFSERFAVGDRTIGYIILGSDNLATDVAILRTYVASAVKYE